MTWFKSCLKNWHNLATFIQKTVGYLLRLIWRINIRGRENVPHEGPVILCANHSGLIDGVVLLLASERTQTVIAKFELFKPPFGFIFSAGDGIAIDWKSPDRHALCKAIDALGESRVLGIFPEGTRCRGQYDWLKDGVTYVLVNSIQKGYPVQVVPVTIIGTRNTGQPKSHFTRFGKRIEVHIAKPLSLAHLNLQTLDLSNRQQLHAAGEQLRLLLQQQVRDVEKLTGMSMPEDDVSDHRERP